MEDEYYSDNESININDKIILKHNAMINFLCAVDFSKSSISLLYL